MAVLTTPRPGARRGLHCWLAFLTVAVMVQPSVQAQPVARESQIKAVFLYNFVRFVDWPPSAFPDTQAPMVIGVLGEDPFGAALDDAIRGESVNGRPLEVRHFRRIEDLGDCQVLFISRSEATRLAPILTSLKGRSVLTVSDAEDFTNRGGMIRFVTENNKVRLKINIDAAKAAELTISSKLLRPAEVVTATPNK